MLVDSVAGAFLLAGAVACAVAAVRGRPSRAALALALAVAGRRRAGRRSSGREIAACALGDRRDRAARARAARARGAGCRGSTRSWAPRRPAALAVALGAAPRRGRRRAAAWRPASRLCRWRPGRAVLLALAGLAALAAARGVAPRRRARVRRRRVAPASRAPRPGPEFSPIVLAAILTFATTALALLTVGPVHRHRPTVAVALAIVTVLTGMARAGITVVERLRESRARRRSPTT